MVKRDNCTGSKRKRAMPRAFYENCMDIFVFNKNVRIRLIAIIVPSLTISVYGLDSNYRIYDFPA